MKRIDLLKNINNWINDYLLPKTLLFLDVHEEWLLLSQLNRVITIKKLHYNNM